MIVFVIGSQGQLARSLVELHSPKGMTVIARGRPSVDVLKPESISHALDIIRPDVVVNAAAYTAVDKAESEKELAFAVNAEGPAQLGAITASRGIPVIHVSTDYVYDGTKPSPYVETDPVTPLSTYGRSKLAGERSLAEANARHVILRTAWVHSPFGHNFVRTMLRLSATRSEIEVVDDQLGNPTYAPHLAAFIAMIVPQIAAAPVSNKCWGTYHAVGCGETTWFGFAREVFKCAAAHNLPAPRLKAITSAEYPTPAKRPANSRLDTARLTQTFGAILPHWTEGVAACVAQLLASPAQEFAASGERRA